MHKKILKKVMPLIIFITIIILSYTELYKNLKIIKKDNEENPFTPSPIELNPINSNDINLVLGDKESSTIITPEELPEWIAIERNDSSNNELNYYTPNNVTIEGDLITITSREEELGDKMYTSGLVESTSSYKYGYYEFLIEISKGKGLFPAIWLLPEAGYALPEIDIFEMVGDSPYSFYGVIHFIENGYQDSEHFKYIVMRKKQYTVSLDWQSNSLTWYIDGEKMYSTTKGVPQEYMYIIVNQAIGGNWPGDPDKQTVFPNEFKVKVERIEPIFKKSRY